MCEDVRKMIERVNTINKLLNENTEENTRGSEYFYYLYDIAEHIVNTLADCNYDSTEVKPLKIYLFGSRIKGTNRKTSDLDALFLYEGTLRSKYLQDALNLDGLKLDRLVVDISPVNIDEENYLRQISSEYDISKLPVYNF